MRADHAKRGMVVVGALGLAAALGVAFTSARGSRARRAAPSDVVASPPVGAPAAARPDASGGPSASAASAAPLRETVHDRKTRDELRRRILAGWAAVERSETNASPRAPRATAPPNQDGTGMAPAYIQSVVREELFPMVSQCYEELLARSPRARGRVELSYAILGEPEVGGVVDEVEVKADRGLDDEKLTTCVRESMASIAFKPPKDGGKVTVVYPIELAPDDDDDPKKP